MDNRLNELFVSMLNYYSNDPKRIQHFVKVNWFCKFIGFCEGMDKRELCQLGAAALVHDIGIKSAEEKYGKGNCGGKLQEQLGVEPARKMLEELGFDAQTVERVCFLVSHHHTYDGIDSLDWQILVEADFLVNAYEDGMSVQAIRSFRDKVFKTKTGIEILETMFEK